MLSSLPNCRLCKRECSPSSVLCRYHLVAKRNIESAYGRWVKGYGSLSWGEYLRQVSENPETGEWAREVAGLLLKERIE
jgi:hypothetical protein